MKQVILILTSFCGVFVMKLQSFGSLHGHGSTLCMKQFVPVKTARRTDSSKTVLQLYMMRELQPDEAAIFSCDMSYMRPKGSLCSSVCESVMRIQPHCCSILFTTTGLLRIIRSIAGTWSNDLALYYNNNNNNNNNNIYLGRNFTGTCTNKRILRN